MCGRYYFRLDGDDPAVRELKKRISRYPLLDFTQGEVFPTQHALVLVKGNGSYVPSVKPWGMHGYQNRLIINARCEGIETKKMFFPHLHNRCIIPCNGFYEWINRNGEKDKIYITKKEKTLQYLAGFYNQRDEFVIITGASQNMMKNIHERTPIMLSYKAAEAYLQGGYPLLVDNDDLIFQKI